MFPVGGRANVTRDQTDRYFLGRRRRSIITSTYIKLFLVLFVRVETPNVKLRPERRI